MTVRHSRHWYKPGSESTRRSGAISSYNPAGGPVRGRSNSQRQTAASSRSRRLGTSAGTSRVSRGLRGISRRQGRL